MTMPSTPPAASWHVTNSVPRTQIGPDGTPVDGLQVTYATGAGGTGTVFAPKGQDSVDQVRALVAAAAARTDAINSLTSGS